MIEEAIAEVMAAHPEQVARWRRREPGAWGFLAGQVVLAYRRRLGRSPTDAERRQVWSAAWAALEASPS